MKKIFLFSAVILFFLPATICMSQITKQQAITFVMDSIVGNQVDSVNVYIDDVEQISPYYIINLLDTIPSPYSNYWLFFIDLQPGYGWKHSCEYVFINSDNGNLWEALKTYPPDKSLHTLDQISMPIDPVICFPDFTVSNTTNYPPVNHHLYAVMFSGGEPGTSGGDPAFWNAISLEYCTLREHGFPKENIYVLSYNGAIDGFNNPSLDLDNDGQPDIINKVCTHQRLDSIFNALSNRLTTSDLLYVFAATHQGDTPASTLHLYDTDVIYDVEFANDIANFNCAQIIINIWACGSGGFVKKTQDIQNSVKKTILTSTGASACTRLGNGFCMDTYNYLVGTALRGWHFNIQDTSHYYAPWNRWIPIGTIPDSTFWKLLHDTHHTSHDINFDLAKNGGNNDFVQEINEVIKYVEENDPEFALYGTKQYVDGFVHQDPNHPEHNVDLLSLHGITGPITFPQTLACSQTDNGHFLIGGDLSVDSGASLTLNQGVTFHIWNSALVLKPGIILQNPIRYLNGGTLTVNGGILTSSETSWNGIEICGNKNYSQLKDPVTGYCAQGTLVLNNATIKNALNITLFNPEEPEYVNSTGGIIKATNSLFLNNRRSAEFRSYHNFPPNNPSWRIGNSSYFVRCEFTVDDSYNLPDPFSEHIKLYDVEGITVAGCNFKNLNQSLTGFGRGIGINSLDACFYVRHVCSSTIDPCPPTDAIPSTFQGFFAGINAHSVASANTFVATKSQFLDNSYGIRLNAVNHAIITRDTFDIGSNTICPGFTGIGIELNKCDGYQIEENNFKHTPNNFEGVYYGIRVIGLNDATFVNTSNELYLNTFHDINLGNEADLANANGNGIIGLCYLCNKNHNNFYDFNVTGFGIPQYQGSSTSPAGNTFSKHNDPNYPYSDFNNLGNFGIRYYYNGDSYHQPVNVCRVDTYPTNNQNSCASHIGNENNGTEHLTNGQIDSLQQAFAYYTDAYNNTKNLLESLKDGGSTSDLTSDISSSTSDETMTLRNELLGDSPHLSKEVLEAAADKTNVLPDPILFEILAANPDELRSDELMNYLQSKTNPLPDYMIEMLSEIAADTTHKTTLELALSKYKTASSRSAHSLIRNILQDTVLDLTNLRNWLDNQHSITTDYQIIDSWLQEKNTSSALALLNLIPQLYTLDSIGIVEYNYYKNLKIWQADLINQNIDICDLDSTQIAFVQNIATNSQDLAGLQASNLLDFAYGVKYINCPPSPDGPVKQKIGNKGDLLNKIYQPRVTVLPNPSNDWVAFSYQIFKGEYNSSIRISNLNNEVIKNIPLNGYQGQVVMDTREIPSGMYIYTLINGPFSKSGKLSISH
jgi:hypothetical protein